MPGFPPSGRKKRGKRIADKEEKLDLMVVMNLICILIPALLAQQVTDFFRHDVELPTKAGKGSPQQEAQEEDTPKKPAFNLKLAINGDGTFTIINAKALTPSDGLVQVDVGLTVPASNGETPNYRLLQQVLHKEKRQRLAGQPAEAYPDPDQITITGPQDLSYQKLIETLDYVRFAPLGPGGSFDADAEALFTLISLFPGRVAG